MSLLSEGELLALAAVAQIGTGAYGVTIREEIEQRTGRSLSIGSLYKTIHRLESRGFVRVALGKPSGIRGGRAKKLVALEPAGREALAASIEAFENMVDGLRRDWKPT